MTLIVAAAGFHIGLTLTAFGFGFRHGVDWDHIAAITDLTGSQENSRRSMLLATMYALGHALVVFILGVLAIVVGERLPDSVDEAMGRIVGLTLVVLGTYVLISLARHGRDFRMRSRWMLVFAGVRKAVRWVKGRGRRAEVVVVTHEHPHDPSEPHPDGHAVAVVAGGTQVATATQHRHGHRHVGTVPDDPFTAYSYPTAFGVGMIHGVGAETPTQVLVFVTAAGAGGASEGVALLACFIAGLLASNSLIALASTFGFLNASRNWPVYAVVSVVTAVLSLAIGTLFLFGDPSILPAFFSG